MQIDHHNDAGLNCDTKQGYVTDPRRYAEVEPHNILKNQSAGHRINGRNDKNNRFGQGMKQHVEQDEYDCKYDRQNVRQSLSSAELKFILPRPFERVAGWQE